MRHTVFSIVTLLFIISLPVESFSVTDDWKLGFISQGYTDTSDNVNYGGESVEGSFENINIGFNISSDQQIKRSRISWQATYRNFGGYDENDFELDYLVFDYNLLSALDYRMCVDLGWLKTHFGFFVSGWDVVHARPFAILPISFYQ